VSREDKRGYIPGETPQILEPLNIDPEQFIGGERGTLGHPHHVRNAGTPTSRNHPGTPTLSVGPRG
jgi:hypothetical protein